jgi:hypothetical protein
MRYGLVLASPFFVAAQVEASSINSFTFTTDSSPFTTNLVESFSGSEASLTGTVSCDSTVACKGEVGTFDLGVDFTGPTTPVSIDISGNLNGATPGVGLLHLSSPISKTHRFTIPDGSFDKTLVSTNVLPFGMVDVTGSFDLVLAPDQTVTLPLTFNIGPRSSVPEPSGEALLLLCALGAAGFVRYRYSRTLTTSSTSALSDRP